MYKKLSQQLTISFISHGILSKEDKEIYEYGFEVLISTFVSLISIFIIAIIVQRCFLSLLFVLGFIIARMCCGGYHAKHHTTCLLTTLGNYFLFLLATKEIDTYHLPTIIILLLVISIVIILCLAPMEHPFNPFTNQQKKRLKHYIYFLITALCVISICCLMQKVFFYQILSINIGVFSVSISLILAKIESKIKNTKKGGEYK